MEREEVCIVDAIREERAERNPWRLA